MAKMSDRNAELVLTSVVQRFLMIMQSLMSNSHQFDENKMAKKIAEISRTNLHASFLVINCDGKLLEDMGSDNGPEAYSLSSPIISSVEGVAQLLGILKLSAMTGEA